MEIKVSELQETTKPSNFDEMLDCFVLRWPGKKMKV